VPATSSSLSAFATALKTARASSTPLSAADSVRLLQALSAVPDPRRARGRRHSLQSILLLALQAVMAGTSSWVAIAQWAATAPQALAVCGVAPSAATFRRVLAAVDIAALEAALTRWVSGRAAAAGQPRPAQPAAARRTVLAVDGKTLRGAHDATAAQTKLISVYDHAHGLVLAQAAVADGDEVTAFTAALNTLPDLGGALVTADALHCQRGHAQYLAARGGHYLFTVKANQPTLRTALRRLPWATAPGSRRRDRGHGRRESRSIKVIDLGGTGIDTLFPGARRAIKVVRRRTLGDGRRLVETVYAVTSLDHRAVDPGLLAGWLRSHWEIENRVHHVRDVTQREDACRIRTGNGPQVMAALRNTANNIARLNGHDNIAAAQRAAAWHPTAITDALNAARSPSRRSGQRRDS
jgi:predicted transposase YbfD/YdcC